MTMRSDSISNRLITVSAPGKALIAGGYLVLESPNPGLVLATDSCFHVTIALRDSSNNDNDTDVLGGDDSAIYPTISSSTSTGVEGSRYCPLDVYSPQFHQVYRYWLLLLSSSDESESSSESSSPLVQLLPRYSNQPSNPYVEKTIVLTLSFAILQNRSHDSQDKRSAEKSSILTTILDTVCHPLPSSPSSTTTTTLPQNMKAIAIQLRADNDFYSPIPHLNQRNQKCLPKHVSNLPPFLPCPIIEEEEDDDEKDKNPTGDNNSNGTNDDTRKTSKKKVVKVNKTGLGSSAALVSSLVGALLSFFDIVPPLPFHNRNKNHDDSDDGDDDAVQGKEVEDNKVSCTKEQLDIIHNLAQICHSIAQGKIGSGFDVSAAIYGSQVYTRFHPNVIRQIMEELSQGFEEEQVLSTIQTTNGSSSSNITTTTDKKKKKKRTMMQVKGSIATKMHDCILSSTTWDAKVEPLSLPNGIELMMADVCGGSESPSMAKRVLAWKTKIQQQGPKQQKNEWDALTNVNLELKELFERAPTIMKEFQSNSDDDGIVSALASKCLKDYFVKEVNDNDDDGEDDDISSKFSIPVDESVVNDLVEEILVSRRKRRKTSTTTNGNNVVESDDVKKGLQEVILPTLMSIRKALLRARLFLKQMGNSAGGIPIEPDEQTELADLTMDLPGVIAAGVPGAGGYDALYVLYVKKDSGHECKDGDNVSSDEVRDRIGQLWLDWCEKQKKDGKRGIVCPLACKSAGFGTAVGMHQCHLEW